MMAPGHDGNPGDSGSPSRQDPAGSKKDTTQPPNLTGQMRAPARRVRRRSDPAPGGFVMHWKLDKKDKKRGVIVPIIVNASGQLVSSPQTFMFNTTPSQQQLAPSQQHQQSAQFVISNTSPPSSSGSSQRGSSSSRGSPIPSPRSSQSIPPTATGSPPPLTSSTNTLMPGMVVPGNSAHRQVTTVARLAAAPYERRRSSLPDLRLPGHAPPVSHSQQQPHQQTLPPHMYPQLLSSRYQSPPAPPQAQTQQQQQHHPSIQHQQQSFSDEQQQYRVQNWRGSSAESLSPRLAPFGGSLASLGTAFTPPPSAFSPTPPAFSPIPPTLYHQNPPTHPPLQLPPMQQPNTQPALASLYFTNQQQQQSHPHAPRVLSGSISPVPMPEQHLKPLLEQVAHSLLIIGDSQSDQQQQQQLPQQQTTYTSTQPTGHQRIPLALPSLSLSPPSPNDSTTSSTRMSIGALLCASPRSRDSESKPLYAEPDSSSSPSSATSSASGSYIGGTLSGQVSGPSSI